MVRLDAKQHPGLFLGFLCVGLFLVYMDMTIVNVALFSIQEDLKIEIMQLQWIFDAYALTFACFLLTSGTLGDRFGRKKVFLVGLVGFTIASILCALAPSVDFLIIVRVLQGICGSAMIPVSLALITEIYKKPDKRAQAIGIWGGVGGIALATGPVIGGFLADNFGWESIFWINVPFAIIAFAVLVLIRQHTIMKTPSRIDFVGQVLFIVAIFELTYVLVEGNAVGWGSSKIIVACSISLICFLLFIFWERRCKDPLLPLTLFRNPVFTIVCLVNFLCLFGVFGILFLFPLYLQEINGLTGTQTGTEMMALTIAIMVTTFIAPNVAQKIGSKQTIIIGSLLAGFAFLALTVLQVGSSFSSYWWMLALIGVGVSLVGPPGANMLLSTVPPQYAATASAVSNTFRQIGAVFGVAIAGAFVQLYLKNASAPAMKASDFVNSHLTGINVHTVANQALIKGMHMSVLVFAAGSIIGAIFTIVYIKNAGKSPGNQVH